MDDLSKVETSSYEAAKRNKYTYKDHLMLVIKFISIITYSIIEYLPILFNNFCDLFQKTKLKDISGQVALVTGGGNGIGKQICNQLAIKGCHLAIADISYDSAVETAKEIANTYNVKTKAFKVDVSNFEAIEKLKDDIESSLGYVDILVNNAGLLPLMSLREGSHKDIQKIIDVNLSAHFWTCRVFLNGMIKRKRGHIVALASAAAYCPFPRGCAYVATKFAVRGFMDALYLELSADNFDKYINLTTVFPFFVSTRHEIDKILDAINQHIPRLSPVFTAKRIVNGILTNKMSVYVPGLAIYNKFFDLLPKQLLKNIVVNTMVDPKTKLMDNGL